MGAFLRLRVTLGAGAVESLASNGRFVLRARAFGYRSGVQRSDEAQNQLFDFSHYRWRRVLISSVCAISMTSYVDDVET